MQKSNFRLFKCTISINLMMEQLDCLIALRSKPISASLDYLKKNFIFVTVTAFDEYNREYIRDLRAQSPLVLSLHLAIT